MPLGSRSVVVGGVLAFKILHSIGIQIWVQSDHCGSLSALQYKPRSHKSSPAVHLIHLRAPAGLLGPDRRREGATTYGKHGSVYNHARGETEGIGLGSPACSRRGQPFLLSLHLVRCAWSLLTAQLENVTSLERFPRALPGSQPPRQAPSADSFFANPAASWMAGLLPAQRIVSGEPPHRWLGYPCLDASARVLAGGSGGAPRGGPPSRSRRGPAPRLLVRPRAQPRTPSGGVEAVTGGTRLCGPCEERGAFGLRPREQRRDGAQPHGQTAAHRSRSSLGPSGCPPAGDPLLARPAPAAPRDPRSALVRPPGAARPLRPTEWPRLLAAGAAQGRREAGSARISINLGPRRELRQPPPRRQPPAPAPSCRPKGRVQKHEVKK